jgi:hypothetical protein
MISLITNYELQMPFIITDNIFYSNLLIRIFQTENGIFHQQVYDTNQ